jgi:hypothetical protein
MNIDDESFEKMAEVKVGERDESNKSKFYSRNT